MDASTTHEDPLLAEDLLLLLFDPRTGTVAGKGAVPRVLARALLADLVLQERVVVVGQGTSEVAQVHASGGGLPSHPVLRDLWRRVAQEPVAVPTLLDAVSPHVHQLLLDRLVAAGHVRRRRRLVGVSALVDGGSWRRRELLAALRPVLGRAREVEPRTAALAGLLSASGSLPFLHPDILWSRAVWTRGAELEQGDVVAATDGGGLRASGASATPGLLLS